LDFSLRPLLTAIEQRLSMDDVTVRGQYVEFDLDDFLRGDPLTRADVYSKLIPLGVLTVDEAREEEDLVR
jgi:phage portal protein BeeE